jgi:hypothetical protein
MWGAVGISELTLTLHHVPVGNYPVFEVAVGGWFAAEDKITKRRCERTQNCVTLTPPVGFRMLVLGYRCPHWLR